MSESGLRGRWLWVQLLTPDAERSIDFYSSVFGWEPQTYSAAGQPYRFWTANGEPIAGLHEKPPEAKGPAAWLGYVGTTDVERTAQRAVGLGAKLLREPSEVPTVGRFAVLADPAGALFALYRPMSGKAPPVEAPGLGEISWHELATADVEGAFDFYGQLFAWKRGSTHDLGEIGAYHLYERTGTARGGIYRRSEEVPSSFWLHYVRVAGIAAAIKRVTSTGGAVVHRPLEVPGGDLVAICADPDGAAFALHEVRPR